MFEKTNLLNRYYRNTFDDKALAEKIRDVIATQARAQGVQLGAGESDYTLGTAALKTYLLLVMRNATTDSPWPVSNNPAAKFNDPALVDCNLKLPLWQLVRASTAAPTYFPPEIIRFPNCEFIFVDGGVTMYNNPAFQLFLMATTAPYRLQWPTGEDEMLVVSVGTGAAAAANTALTPDEMNIVYNAKSLPSALMYAASNEQDFLCRVFGRCLNGNPIDCEIGDLIGDPGPHPAFPKLFTYMRYNADLSRDGLTKLGLPGVVPEDVQQLDSVAHIGDLQNVGRAVADQVRIEDFKGFLA
jgi:hypothetical protein